jgi:lipoprotein-releasing system permease protein
MILDFLFRFLFSKRAGAVIRRISWLTFGGLTVSVAALILVLSVMKALNGRIQERTLAAEPHLWIEVPGVNRPELLEAHPVSEKIRAHPEWKSHLQETQDVILRTLDGRFQGAVARGLSAKGLELVLSQIEEVNARQRNSGLRTFPKPEELENREPRLRKGEVLLGVDLAHSLGVFEGDVVMIIPPEGLLLPPGEAPRFEKARVREILASNLSDVDAKTMFYLRGETLAGFTGSASRKMGIELWLDDPSRSFEVREDLEKLSGVKAETWQERNSALFFALRMERLVIGIFLGIAALVAGFSLLSVLGLLISQKRKEMGLLQALGLGPWGLRRLLIGLGMGLGGLGIFAGALIGTGLSLYLQFYPLRVLPDIYYDAEIPARTDWFLILLVIAGGLSLAYLGSRQMGAWVHRANPSELLRNQARS